MTTGPFCISATMSIPSIKSSITTGIVTLAPSTPAPMANHSPGFRFTTITPTAPAFCALNAFAPNSQVFRKMTAILPVKLLINGLQPSPEIGFPCAFKPGVPSSTIINVSSTNVFGIRKSGVPHPPVGGAQLKV